MTQKQHAAEVGVLQGRLEQLQAELERERQRADRATEEVIHHLRKELEAARFSFWRFAITQLSEAYAQRCVARYGRIPGQ